MPMSENLSNKLSALIRSNTPIPAYAGANRWVALHTVDPTKTCLIGELSTGNYSRVQLPLIDQAGADGNDLTNNSILVFPLASATIAEQITHFSIWDNQVGGTPITYGVLSTPVNWTQGSSLSLAVNAFIQTIRNKIPA